jgi:hypothetical protein
MTTRAAEFRDVAGATIYLSLFRRLATLRMRFPHVDDLNVTVGDSLRSWQHGVNPNGGKKISKVLIILAMIALTVAAADAGVPRRHDAWQTLTGTCTKVTVMDASADPTVCSDQVATIKFSDGMLGFAFTIRPPGTSKPWIMSFFATRSSHSGAGSDKTAESLPIHRVYFTIDDKTDDLDRASCFGSAQHLEPTTEAVIARRRYWLHVMPRSANALC